MTVTPTFSRAVRRVSAVEASMLPEPVPPYTRLTLLLEKVLTFASAARGSALLLFISRAAPSASTCWVKARP